MVYFMETPIYKRMIWRYPPFVETPIYWLLLSTPPKNMKV